MHKKRLPELDGLRIMCVGAIVAWHALLPFSSRARGVKADISSPAVDLLVWLTRGYALKVLFLLAGFLAYQSLQRYGPAGYWRHRGVRLLAPTLLAMLFYNLLLHWRWATALNLSLAQVVHYHLARGDVYEVFSARHLWFLWDLALMSLLVPLLPAQLGLRLGSLMQRPWGWLLVALPTAGMLGLHQPHLPILEPGRLIPSAPTYPVLSAFGYHLVFFLVGWGLAARSSEWAFSPWLLPLGICLRAVHYALVFHAPRTVWLLPVVHLTEALCGWALALGAWGLFTGRLRVDRPLWRYLADSGYWCYLSHPFFLGELQLLLNGRGWPWPVQWFTVLLASWALMLLTYEFFVRYTPLGRLLHGERHRQGGLGASP